MDRNEKEGGRVSLRYRKGAVVLCVINRLADYAPLTETITSSSIKDSQAKSGEPRSVNLLVR